MPPRRRRRFDGLYYHSSPPRVIGLNGQMINYNNDSHRRRRDVDDFSIKLSTIRIWMHEKDIANLTRILWAGQGNRLRQQASTNPRIKRFLNVVPHAMNSIKDVHQAVIDNNLDALQSKLEPPVPPALITSRDVNGLNLLHKAAGLGRATILEYLITSWPEGVHETDITGKTPLHWAASAKNNQRCYSLLTSAGADEEALDYKLKTPAYYRHKPNDIERTFLMYVPEAPRVPPDQVPDWDALIDSNSAHGQSKKPVIKIPAMNGSNASSNQETNGNGNVSEADVTESNASVTDEEDPVTAEKSNLLTGRTDPVTAKEDSNELRSTELAAMHEILNESGEDAAGNAATHAHEENGQQVDDTEHGNGRNDLNNDSTRLEDDEPNENAQNAAEGNQTSPVDDDEKQLQTTASAIDADSIVQTNDPLAEQELETQQHKPEQETNQTEHLQSQNEDEPIKDSSKQDANTKPEMQDSLGNENVVEAEESLMLEENEKSEQEKPSVTANGIENNFDSSQDDNDLRVDKSLDRLEPPRTAVIRSSMNPNDHSMQQISNQNELNGTFVTNSNQDINDNNQKDLHDDGDVESLMEANNPKEDLNKEKQEEENSAKDAEDANQENDEVNALIQLGLSKSSPEEEEEEEEEILVIREKSDCLKDINEHNQQPAVSNGVDDAADADEEEDDEAFDAQQTNDLAKAGKPATPESANMIQTLQASRAERDLQEQAEYKTSTPTSCQDIEGFVQGQADINAVQSESVNAGATDGDEGLQLKEIVAAGDVEKLAEIVLNGEGEKLLHLRAKQPEVQAFLNNVSSYMNKIQRVHEAARSGSLLSLQQALDRRKFAIAKYSESANGASPLHVAILFGHTDIVRYLSSRFPETTSVTDAHGRTPLHYAAVIDDNGHFYNILLRAGANPKAKDQFGYTPKQYINDEELKTNFNYRQLLRDFNAEELATDLLVDRVPDDLYSSRRLLQDMDIIETLERCYAVIQDSSRVWENMMASAANGGHQFSSVGAKSTLQFAVTSYLSRFLKPSIYESIKLRQTRQDHTLFDVIWPALRKTTKERPLEEDINCGLIAPDYDVYIVFQEFLLPLLKDMHGLNASTDLEPHPSSCYFPNSDAQPAEDDVHFAWHQSVDDLVEDCTIECSRNLNDFELPLNLTYDQLDHVEQIIMTELFKPAFTQVINERDPGSYYALAEVFAENSKIANDLEANGLLIPLLRNRNVDDVQIAESASFNGTLWPYGRGVYISASQNLAVWVNCQDHLRIITCTNISKGYDDIGATFTLIGRIISHLQNHLKFKFSYFMGHLQSRPAYLGTGLKITTNVSLPHFMHDVHNLRHMCSLRGLHLFTAVNDPAPSPRVRIANMQSMGLNEFTLFQDYCAALNNLLTQERRQSEGNSQQIAALLNDMFHRRRENEHFQDNDIFQTEQGQYLADNLAEPLIKALTQIASKRPEDPLLYLTNYLQDYISTRNNQTQPEQNELAGRTSSTQTVSTATIDSVSPVNRKANKNAGEKQTTGAHMEDIAEYDESSDAKSNGDSPDTLAAKMMEQRDEHGQSMLHFACAHSNRKGALMALIDESDVDITYRDELYRTARDVSLQANQLSNAKEIDRYVLSLAVVGDVKPFQHFALSGYDHILDVFDDEGKVSILDLAQQHNHTELVEFLQSLQTLEELREELHNMIRTNNMEDIKNLVQTAKGKWLIKAKNYYGRTALHIAILKESLEIAEYLMQICPEAVKIGDNLERTVLHYAMGTNSIENLSRILIQSGAKRISKDLKGRQPSYYFMNKADILRLQEEENETH